MRIAILETGRPPAELEPRFGGYGAMMAAMLGEGFETTRHDVPAGDLPTGADGYLITGSAAGVYDDLPWIAPLKDWIAGTAGSAPLLGICFGHQIMAEALGGRAAKSDRGWGVGLHRYRMDAATVGWSAPEIALPVSHQDQVVAVGPEGRVIGGTGFCPNGVIAYPALRALSLQPHPEFDPAFATALIETRRDGPLQPEHADAAVISLGAPNDRAAAADWLRRWYRDA